MCIAAKWPLLAAAAWLTLAQAPVMANVVIDDFSSGAFNLTLGPDQDSSDLQRGSMVGGQRNVAFQTDSSVSGLTDLSTVAVTTGDHRFTMETGAGVAQSTSVLYGYDGSPGGLTPLALNLSGEDRIRIDFAYNTAELNFNILLYNTAASYPFFFYTQIGDNIPANDRPFSVDFAFADGIYPGGPIDFSHIDLIFLDVYSTVHGQAFAMTSVTATTSKTAVPEPASMSLLATGVLLLARRRTRR